MAPAKQTPPLIIAGMHRSGTSMVAKMLQHSGVNIGSDLVEANDGNEHGYHEDKDFVKFHDDVLGRSEQRIFVQDESYLECLRDEDVESASRLISQRNANGLWGWKDPRTSLFLDLWSELLPRAKFVFVFRHPVDVVLSLMRRGFKTELEVRADPLVGLRSWEVHSRALLTFFAQQPESCLLCNVYGLVEEPITLVHAVRNRLGLPLKLRNLDHLIHSKDLHASRASSRVDALLRRSMPRVAALYHELESMADIPAARCTPRDHGEVSETAERLDIITSWLSSNAKGRVTTRPLLAAAFGMLDPAATLFNGGHLRSRLSKAEDRMVDLETHGRNLEGEVAERDAAIQTLKKQVSDLESLRRQSGERVKNLTDHCENLEHRAAERKEVLANLRSHAKNLEAGRERNEEMMLGLSEHIANLEVDREQDRERLLELSKHIANLEVDRQRHEERVLELSRHIVNLEADLERDEARERELSKHGFDLEKELAERQSRLGEVGAHVRNLEADRERDQERVRELSKHADNQETELLERRSALDALKAHAQNLEAGRERDRTRIFELSKHAENLEQALSEVRVHRADLEGQIKDLEQSRNRVLRDLQTHVKNLEAERGRDQDRIAELTCHADNLESILEGVRNHVENLEAQRVESDEKLAENREGMGWLKEQLTSRQNRIEQLTEQSTSQQNRIEQLTEQSTSQQNRIEQLTEQSTSQQNRIERLTEQSTSQQNRIGQLTEQSTSRQHQIERLKARLEHFTSSLWVRLLWRLRMLRRFSDADEI